MRTAATLTALVLALGLAACTTSEPHNEPEALPYPHETYASPSAPPAKPTPSPAPEPTEVEDPAAEVEAFYTEHDLPYYGEAVTEEVSLGLCAQYAADSDLGVGTAFRELITHGGYAGEDAAAAVVAAVAYCPEHRDAVDEWATAVAGVDDWAQETGTLDD